MKKDWEYYRDKAIDCIFRSELYLQKAVQSLAKEKGFNEEQISNFHACFATGNETIVSYNNMGEMADLDLSIMAMMTKEEILDRLNTGECFDIFSK